MNSLKKIICMVTLFSAIPLLCAAAEPIATNTPEKSESQLTHFANYTSNAVANSSLMFLSIYPLFHFPDEEDVSFITVATPLLCSAFFGLTTVAKCIAARKECVQQNKSSFWMLANSYADVVLLLSTAITCNNTPTIALSCLAAYLLKYRFFNRPQMQTAASQAATPAEVAKA